MITIRQMDKLFYDMANFPVRDEREYLSIQDELDESEDHYLLTMDVPGLRKEDLKIELIEQTLTLTGESKNERKTRSFKKSYRLPKNIDVEKIEAHHENGVIEVYLPKQAAATPRRIEFKTQSGGFFEKFLNPKKVENAH